MEIGHRQDGPDLYGDDQNQNTVNQGCRGLAGFTLEVALSLLVGMELTAWN